MSGNLAIVGTGTWPGGVAESAYVFELGSARQRIKLTAPDASGPIGFGHCVAIDGTVAVVAAYYGQRDVTGVVYVFDVDTRELRLKLTRPETAGFGASVAAQDGMILVAPTEDQVTGRPMHLTQRPAGKLSN